MLIKSTTPHVVRDKKSTGKCFKEVTPVSAPLYARSLTAVRSALKAESTTGSVGCLPRSHSTRWAHPKPENTTAFTPCPGNVLSPTQYRPCRTTQSNDSSIKLWMQSDTKEPVTPLLSHHTSDTPAVDKEVLHSR